MNITKVAGTLSSIALSFTECPLFKAAMEANADRAKGAPSRLEGIEEGARLPVNWVDQRALPQIEKGMRAFAQKNDHLADVVVGDQPVSHIYAGLVNKLKIVTESLEKLYPRVRPSIASQDEKKDDDKRMRCELTSLIRMIEQIDVIVSEIGDAERKRKIDTTGLSEVTIGLYAALVDRVKLLNGDP